MAVELGSERLCCNHTRQLLCHHWCLKFDRYDERHCAELTLSSLDTLTIASDVPTQEQGVSKRWIIQNSVVPAWKQSCRRPKVTTGASTRSFRPGRMEREDKEPQRKRHRPEGEGRQPLAPPREGGSSSAGSALPDATVEQQGESKRRREHPGVAQAADSSGSSSESSTDAEVGFGGRVHDSLW